MLVKKVNRQKLIENLEYVEKARSKLAQDDDIWQNRISWAILEILWDILGWILKHDKKHDSQN